MAAERGPNTSNNHISVNIRDRKAFLASNCMFQGVEISLKASKVESMSRMFRKSKMATKTAAWDGHQDGHKISNSHISVSSRVRKVILVSNYMF